MALLGFLLFAASVATAVSIAVSNTDAVAFDVFGENVTDVSPGGLMLMGAGLSVAAVLGLWMIAAGLRRMRRRREENRIVVRENRSRVDELEEENIRLRDAAGRAAVAQVAPVAPTAMPTTSVAGSSTGFATGHDLDDADRAERHPTPTMATSPGPIDLRETDEPVAYPRDTFAAPDGEQTPAFDETTRQQEGRVFGRRNR